MARLSDKVASAQTRGDAELSLGEKLVMYRAANNHMSQGELAEVLGVSQQTLSRWEKDTSLPTGDNLQKITSLLEGSDQEITDRIATVFLLRRKSPLETAQVIVKGMTDEELSELREFVDIEIGRRDKWKVSKGKPLEELISTFDPEELRDMLRYLEAHNKEA